MLNRRIHRRLRTAPPFAKGGKEDSAFFLCPLSETNVVRL